MNLIPASKAQQKAVAKYDAKAYDKTLLRLPKGRLDVVRAHAESHSESVNGFIGRAILETMERDGSGTDVVNRDGGAGGPQEAAGAAAGAGGISLSPDTLESAQQAAERTGEAVGEFLARAVETQVKRDKSSIALGINPATGDKLDSKGGADHE